MISSSKEFELMRDKSTYPICPGCDYPAPFLRDGFCLRCIFDIKPPNNFRTEMRPLTAVEIVVALADLKAASEAIGENALGALIAAIVEVHVSGDDERLAVALGRLKVPSERRRELGVPAMTELHPALRREWDTMKGRPS